MDRRTLLATCASLVFANLARAQPATARVRLIAVTGYGRDEDRQRAYAAGFDDHLVKPADPQKLLHQLAAG